MMSQMLMGSGRSLTLLITGGPAYGSRVGIGSATTSAVTATPTGGTAPYTYAWTFISGDSFTINSPAAASTTFTTALLVAQDKTGHYRCTVTDATGATAYDETDANLVETS